MPSKLTQTQRYAAAALFGLALNQAQIHQTLLLGSSYDEPTEDRGSSASSSDSVSEDPQLWVNDSSGLLRPIFRFLDINDSAWSGLEETAGSSSSSSQNHHIGAFLRLLAEESDDDCSEASDHELALSNAVNAMVASIETTPEDYISKKEKQRAYADELQEKLTTNEPELENQMNTVQEQNCNKENLKNEQDKVLKNDELKNKQGKDLKNDDDDLKNKQEKDLKNDDFNNKQEKDLKNKDFKIENEQEKDLKNELEKDCKMENFKNEQGKDCKKENFENEQEKNCINESIKSNHEKVCKIENYKNEQEKDRKSPGTKEVHIASNSGNEEKLIEEMTMPSYGRKVTVLYELLSACLADTPEDNKTKSKRRSRGYDARHRSALRLLTTWFDIKWIKMEAIEIIVACSAMAVLKEEEAKEENQAPKSLWTKWKRGGIIGAAALTGGTLMAITGGIVWLSQYL